MTIMQSEQPNGDEEFVDELLAGRPVPENAGLKEGLWRHTSAQLRRRRCWRLAARPALLAACFLGGMGTMGLVRPEPEPAKVIVTVVEPRPADPAPLTERRLTAAELELEAEKTLVKEESARRFREAGDRYLGEEQNIAAALRCYRNFLDEAGDAGLGNAQTDTWLLTSLKNARHKETN
jgi:hypothetical protein